VDQIKGLLIAGGLGKRLMPLTEVFSKQLLPLYDKPVVYYPLSTLMLAGIREILIVVSTERRASFERLLGDGREFGIELAFRNQESANGIAAAITLGAGWASGDSVAVILGDNIFHGQGLGESLEQYNNPAGAVIFAQEVKNPHEYGVVVLDDFGTPTHIEEKPKIPKSNLAITGLYFYENDVFQIASNVLPSQRGELEISSINQEYLEQKRLQVNLLGLGVTWLDVGSFDSLLSAASYVKALQDRNKQQIASPHEIAWRKGWISDSQLLKTALRFQDSAYGQYLDSLINQ
jgi:glucose-1-phosphate thymidylyltransferase